MSLENENKDPKIERMHHHMNCKRHRCDYCYIRNIKRHNKSLKSLHTWHLKYYYQRKLTQKESDIYSFDTIMWGHTLLQEAFS